MIHQLTCDPSCMPRARASSRFISCSGGDAEEVKAQPWPGKAPQVAPKWCLHFGQTGETGETGETGRAARAAR